MPLEETSVDIRAQVARLIADVAGWDGFAASVATKVLHKKRPRLIPILDNQAIFGAYMDPHWPGQRSATDSVYAEARIRDALEWISADLTRPGEHPRVGRPFGYRAHTVTNRAVRHGLVGAFPETRTRRTSLARVSLLSKHPRPLAAQSVLTTPTPGLTLAWEAGAAWWPVSDGDSHHAQPAMIPAGPDAWSGGKRPGCARRHLAAGRCGTGRATSGPVSGRRRHASRSRRLPRVR